MICVFSTSYEIYSTSISSYFVIERADACIKKNQLLISDSKIKNLTSVLDTVMLPACIMCLSKQSLEALDKKE